MKRNITKLTTETFIEKAKQVHGDKYDYSKVNYINNKTPITIICSEHGEFIQRPDFHLRGSKCPKCARINSLVDRPYKLTTETFIEKAKQVHGDKYDYSKVNYIDSKTKVCIICPEHGEFWQLTNNHLKGCGCPKCGNNLQLSTSDFINILKNKYPNTNINLNNIKYVNNITLVELKCPIHGKFFSLPSSLYNNLECPECQKIRLHFKYAKTNIDFIKECKQIHKERYDYSKVEYTNSKTKICIICPEHGEFWQLPNTHLKGCGCPKCSAIESWNKREDRMTTEKIISKFNEVHSNKYDYSKVIYKNPQTKICIICPEHGEFWQLPYAHLKGNTCPMCAFEKSSSKNEDEIKNFITNNNFPIITNSRRIIPCSEIDIYIPNKQVAIEFDGLYWHNEIKCKSDAINYHLDKTNKCYKKNIRLIHIFEDEWKDKQEIVKSRLKNVLGIVDNRIFARKCEIRDVDYKTSNLFLCDNHLQGNVVSKYRYGLYYNEELVSIMTFGSLRKNLNSKNKEGNFELLRFCNKLNTTVIGGASKLLKHFINEVQPKEIISYADKRWSNGNLYKKLGFTHTHDSKPNYFYVVGQHRENRFKYRKSELVKQGFDPNKSEHEIMLERGIYRIYDCGTMVFKMKI